MVNKVEELLEPVSAGGAASISPKKLPNSNPHALAFELPASPNVLAGKKVYHDVNNHGLGKSHVRVGSSGSVIGAVAGAPPPA